MAQSHTFAGTNFVAYPITTPDGTTAYLLGATLLDTSGSPAASGGAVTVADGSDVAEGATTDAAVAAGAAGTISAKMRRLTTDLAAFATATHTDLIAATPAGTNIIGKVGIDQTTPGTTNAVVAKGTDATNAAATANPLYMAALTSSTGVQSYTTARVAPLSLTVAGELITASGGAGTNLGDGQASGINLLVARDGTGRIGGTGIWAWTGTGAVYNRVHMITGAVSDGTGSGVLAVEQAGAVATNITTATTTTVKSGKGILHKLMVNTPVASATITAYDNTAGSGTKLATLTLPSVITSLAPFVLPLDIQFTTGLTLVTSGATDITAVTR